jgi:hypothetical protein
MEETAVLSPLSEHILHVTESSLKPFHTIRRPESNTDEDHHAKAWEDQDHEFCLDEQDVNSEAAGHFLRFGL